MIEDLPQPDVPQMATTLFFLLSTFMLTFFKTKTSGLVGYLKLTFRNSIEPVLQSRVSPPYVLITGL
jgi:hypothetical protein